MMLYLQKNFYNLFVFIANVAASDVTWFGVYQPKAPESLQKSRNK
ncbi:hypothetical protein IMSAGC017_02379 [Thomasclavelia cocleata]|uniref:Cyclic lactone autoinducer peptide n=1 Tax=Thomasclavelia cocleata TaxID=69824 RepID=A0A829ZD48_9FIRM|nr:cyclic lactone autoinducer peptide [Thomasclavelia cocleata]GFI42331.1 hypothetical protein IMSAGC017_02379 [Thomasclavelia cocleata]